MAATEKAGIAETFDRTVPYYDDWMRAAVPEFDLLYGYTARLVAREGLASPRVLDLGAGTGLLSGCILGAVPGASLVLLDTAAGMLSSASKRFGTGHTAVSFAEADYRNLSYREKFDCVVSSLSIHHLEHEEKRELFGKIFAALRPGGLFLNLDQVRAPTRALREMYREEWLERVRGKPEGMIRESVERRNAFDRDASAGAQCAWLRAAGFVDVDTPLRHTFIALFRARKPGNRTRDAGLFSA